MVGRVLVMVVLLAALLGALLYSQSREEPFKVSGFVEADEIRLGSRVGGRVLRVLVEEGKAVTRGDALVELEPYDLMERAAEARAQLDAARAEWKRLADGYREEEVAQARARRDQQAAYLDELIHGPREPELEQARARIEEAEAQVELARLEYDRAKVLEKANVESVGRLDRATYAVRAAQAALEARKSELNLLQLGTREEEIRRARAELEEREAAWALAKSGYRVEDIEASAARVKAAEATLAANERAIEELTIHADLDGVIEAIDLKPGDLVAANAPVLSMIDPTRLWVRAYVPENRMAVKIGEPVEISVDSFPGERFAARVTFVARSAEFTPSNVQTPEERSKQVFRIKVDVEEGPDRLRPGMNADVWLDETASGDE